MLGGPEEALEAFLAVEHGGGAEVECDFYMVSIRMGWKGERGKWCKGNGEWGREIGKTGDLSP